jgi:predicted regulator of Ras-like GTPase activity (Roadblock/LC7/MglB family)
MSDAARGQAEAALDALVKQGLLGAGLVGRDGLPLILRFPHSVQHETFSAMTAALLGASEAALQEMAESAPATVTVETARLRLAVAGIDDSHLLVVAAPNALDAARLTGAINEGVRKLKAALGA